jgi:pyruvate decarboxylase
MTGATRHGVLGEAEELIKATGFPYFVTFMSKGSVTEHYPSFGGVYGGAGSIPPVQKTIETSDLVLWIGNYPVSTSNTARHFPIYLG